MPGKEEEEMPRQPIFRKPAHIQQNFARHCGILPSADISADLDLTEASVVLLESTVNMNGHNLLLNPNTTITIRLDTDTPDYIPFFTNVGELEIAGGGLIERAPT